MKSYVIHLIRHGQSEGNLEGRYIGSTDSPLSKKGAGEIHKLKKTGEYPKADLYYSSPLSRCRQTLEIIYPGVSYETIDDFRETDFGEFEGKTPEELKSAYPEYSKWIKGEAEALVPGAESGAQFMYRVCAAFEKLVLDMMKKGIQTASVVTHGGVIMTILSSYGLPKAKFYDWMMQSGCGYSLRITPGLWMRSMVAEVFETLPIRENAEDENVGEARAAANLIFGEKDNK